MTASPPTGYRRFIRANRRLLAFGFLMAFGSSFGQTYFVGAFSPSIEAAFALSHTEWGTIYMIGTLLSAAALPFTGRLIDRMPVRRYAMLVALVFAGACVALATTPTAWMLVPAVFLLRQFGQGLCQHTAVTGMVKFFDQDRGKAVAVATLGFPAGRAILPLAAVTLIGLVGWRASYAGCAILALLMIPAIAWLLRREPGAAGVEAATGASEAEAMSGTRDRRLGQMLRDPFFYMLIPALVAPAILETALNFHQLTVAALKGWSAEWVTSGYAVFAAMTILASMRTGALADRIGATRLLPFALAPLAAGVLVVAFLDHFIWAWVYLGLFGLTSGMMGTAIPLVLAEIYGTRHIGAIRGFAATMVVFGSSLAAPLLGLGLDAALPLEVMAVIGALYVAAASALVTRACRRHADRGTRPSP